jgi:hypothetical protein
MQMTGWRGSQGKNAPEGAPVLEFVGYISGDRASRFIVDARRNRARRLPRRKSINRFGAHETPCML